MIAPVLALEAGKTPVATASPRARLAGSAGSVPAPGHRRSVALRTALQLSVQHVLDGRVLSASSAYIRFRFAFAASNLRRRFTSETVAPPDPLRHSKNVALLTPCFRVRLAIGMRFSGSFSIATIAPDTLL